MFINILIDSLTALFLVVAIFMFFATMASFLEFLWGGEKEKKAIIVTTSLLFVAIILFSFFASLLPFFNVWSK